jgi:hypothetical protein
MAATTASRIERLSTLSAKRVIDPDQELPGAVGEGQVLPDDLLSVRDLDLDLTPEQRRTLSREEYAAITEEGIRFESVLNAGFSIQITRTADLTDPRVVYALHEIGEETRHSRLFVRLLEQLETTGKNPFNAGFPGAVKRRILRFVTQRPPLLYVAVLAGEEIPDLIQKRWIDHPDTDPFAVQVNRYHRQEEARHLAFARAVLPDVWAAAPRRQRLQVRWFGAHLVQLQIEQLFHPGIYEAAGLPGFATWRKVHRSPSVVALRHEATRPIVAQLMEAGALKAGRIPRSWRRLCGIDRHGEPVAA